MKFILLSLIVSSSLMAEVLKKDAQGDFVLTKNTYKASELLADYAKLEGLNLNVASDFDDETFVSQGNLKIGKDRIESFVSGVVGRSGNTIIRFPDSSQLQVILGSDSRYATLPVYTDVAKIPSNDDYIQFNYTVKHISASELSRNMRPFLSRYGRVIDMESSNSIHFTDTANNTKKMVQILNFLDTEETLKSQKEMNELNEKHKKILTKKKGVWDIVTENNGLFIIAFLLIGVILGFGTRGYMMKKIEGGW